MRVGALRHAAGAILDKTAERVSIGLLEGGAQRYGLFPPAGGLPERAMAARISEEGEGLVVTTVGS